MATFDENGNYIKTDWKAGDKITAAKLNKIEESIEAVNNNDISRHVEADARLDALESKSEYDDREINAKIDALEDTVVSNKDATDLEIYSINAHMTLLDKKIDDGVAEVEAIANTVDGKIAQAETNMQNQVNQGKADMEAMVAEVEGELDGLHAKDNELSAQLEYNTNKLYGYNNVLNFKCDDGEYVKGDGQHDDTTGIQKALDSFIQDSNEVYIPSGRYKITEPLTIKRDNIIIKGSSKSILEKNFDGNLFEPIDTVISRITLENLILDGMNKQGHGFYSEREPGSTTTGYTSLILNNVSMVKNAGDGLHLKDSYCVNITDGDYNYNGGNGIYLAGCHGSTLTHVNMFDNEVGLFITGGSFSVSVLSCIIQNCKSEGLKLGASYGVTILNPYMENNGIQNEAPSISCIMDSGDRPTTVSIINPYIAGSSSVTPCGINLVNSRYVEIHNPRLSMFRDEGINVGDDSWLTSIYGINSGIECPKYITDKGSRTAQYGLVGVGLSSHRPSSNYLIPGTSFYDKSLSKPIWFDGSTWRDAQGTSV